MAEIPAEQQAIHGDALLPQLSQGPSQAFRQKRGGVAAGDRVRRVGKEMRVAELKDIHQI
jgi:hypothetical protein